MILQNQKDTVMATAKSADKVDKKSSKQEILEAYEKLLEDVQKQKSSDHRQEKKEDEEKKTVVSAGSNTVEKAIKNLADLKLQQANTIDKLSEDLITEVRRLSEIQRAIEIETKHLEDLHEIKISADSLATLILAQKQKREQFENEMSSIKTEFETEMIEKKIQWAKEREEYERKQKELRDQVVTERKREEEEYRYKIELERRKETDAYETRKAFLEKEFNDREHAIKTREAEYEELKSKVAEFDSVLVKSVETACQELSERLEQQHKFSSELANKDIEGDRRLYKQKIESLEQKIAEQEVRIKELTVKVNESGQQVQSIAVKALEASSFPRTMVNEKIVETSKN